MPYLGFTSLGCLGVGINCLLVSDFTWLVLLFVCVCFAVFCC